MANEASIINNPDNTPSAVSSGYQAQNVILTALMNGIDNTVVIDGVGQCTVKISGPVDVNGVLYSIAGDAVLTPGAGDGIYYIFLEGSGATLTPTLTMDSGVFSEIKNARYTVANKRILNWVVNYNSGIATSYKWTEPRANSFIQNDLYVKNNILAPFGYIYSANMPKFCAYGLSTLVPENSSVNLPFTIESIDNRNSGNGEYYTIPDSGIYLVFAVIQAGWVSNETAAFRFSLWDGSDVIAETSTYINLTDTLWTSGSISRASSGSVMIIKNFSSGDKIYVRATNPSDGTIDAYARVISIAIMRIV